MDRGFPPGAWNIVKALAIGLFAMLVVELSWSLLVLANVRLSPFVPWAVPAGLLLLAAAGAYLAGRGWPRSTSANRKALFRLRAPTPAQLAWHLAAGVLAVAALWVAYAAAGYLAASGRPKQMPEVSPILLVAAVVIGAAVTSIAEEAGLRGYVQASLERCAGPPAAIAASSILFVAIHLSHGAAQLARNGAFYLAAGLIYGLLAYFSQSIVPSFLLHFAGDLLVFGLGSGLINLDRVVSQGARPRLLVCACALALLSVPLFMRCSKLSKGMRVQAGFSAVGGAVDGL